MNREEFIGILSYGLNKLPDKEKREILYDYQEHFDFAIEEGKSEDAIAASLGDPHKLAKEYHASYIINKAEETRSTGNIFRAVFATLSLGFFNLIFILGPFLAINGVLLGFFVASIGLLISGVLLFIAILLYPILPSFVSIPIFMAVQPIGGILVAIGVGAMGILMLIGVTYLAIGIYKLTIKYLKLNIRIITDRRNKDEL